MDINKYQEDAMSFRLESATTEYALINLVGEVGELFSKLAKEVRDGVEDWEAHWDGINKELGDILWHIAAISFDHGWTLEEIAETNLQKLTQRRDRGTIQGVGDER